MHGLIHSFLRSVRWRTNRWFGYQSLYFYSTFTATPQISREDYVFVEVDKEAAERHNQDLHDNGNPDIPIDRLEAGHRCFGFAEPRGDIVSWGWVSAPPSGKNIMVPWEGTLALGLSGPIAYIWDCHTLPRARGRGLYRDNLLTISRLMLEGGSESMLIYCNARNTASMRGIGAAGFRRDSVLSILRAGPVYLLLEKGANPIIAWSGKAVRRRRKLA